MKILSKPNFHVFHRSGYAGTEPPKGENIMLTNEQQHEALLPPGVADKEEITVNEGNQILANWENFEGLEPAHITTLRASQRSQNQSHDNDEALLPPGVE